jgi:hypothetical protein
MLLARADKVIEKRDILLRVPMSLPGPKLTSRMHQWMSAFGGKPDITV